MSVCLPAMIWNKQQQLFIKAGRPSWVWIKVTVQQLSKTLFKQRAKENIGCRQTNKQKIDMEKVVSTTI